MTSDNLNRVRSSCSFQATCNIRAQWGSNGQCGDSFSTSSTYSLLRADCIPDGFIVDPCTDVTISGSLISVTYARDTANNNGSDCKCRLDMASGNDASRSLNISVTAYDIDANVSSVWSLKITSADLETPATLVQVQNGDNVFPAAEMSLVSTPLSLTFSSQGRDTRPQFMWLGFQVVRAVDTGTNNMTLRCGQHVINYERDLASTEQSTSVALITSPTSTVTTSTATTPTTSESTAAVMSTVMTTTTTATPASSESADISPEPSSSLAATVASRTASATPSTTATIETTATATRTPATIDDTTPSEAKQSLTTVAPSATPPTPSAAAYTSVVTLAKSTVADTTSEQHVPTTPASPRSAASRYADEVSEGLPVGGIVGIVVAVVVVGVLVVSLGVRFRRKSDKRSLKHLSVDSIETAGRVGPRNQQSPTLTELAHSSAADNPMEDSIKKDDGYQTTTVYENWDAAAQQKASPTTTFLSNNTTLGKNHEVKDSSEDPAVGLASTLELSHPGSSSDGEVMGDTEATDRYVNIRSVGSVGSASDDTLLNSETVDIRL